MTAIDTKDDIDYDLLSSLLYLNSVICRTLRLQQSGAQSSEVSIGSCDSYFSCLYLLVRICAEQTVMDDIEVEVKSIDFGKDVNQSKSKGQTLIGDESERRLLCVYVIDSNICLIYF